MTYRSGELLFYTPNMNIKKRYVLITLGLVLLSFLLYYFRGIVAYVLIAWVISLAGRPLMRLFEKRLWFGKFKAGSSVAAGLTLFCFLVLITILVALFVPMIINQASNFASLDYTKIVQSFDQPIEDINQRLQSIGASTISRISLEEQLRAAVTGSFDFGQFTDQLSTILSTLGNFLITIVSAIFVAFFFLKDQSLFSNMLLALSPRQNETQIRNILGDISYLLTRYFAGITIQIVAITIFVTAGLMIVGVEYALLIGFFAALANLIPYLGPFIGGIFGLFIAISSNLDLAFYTEMLPLLTKVALVFVAMQMLDNFFLQPYIFSNSVLAHPLEIFIVVLMGAQVAGVTGMVLAIPTYTVLRVIARSFLSEFKVVQKITGGMDLSALTTVTTNIPSHQEPSIPVEIPFRPTEDLND
ncbi:MAG: AI-2E family transporter [Bacteroidota bacterium]